MDGVEVAVQLAADHLQGERRGVVVEAGAMDEQPGGFVDGDEVVVLEKDGQRGWRFGLKGRGVCHGVLNSRGEGNTGAQGVGIHRSHGQKYFIGMAPDQHLGVFQVVQVEVCFALDLL